MDLRPRATVPAPFVAPTTQEFEGDDGQWSTFLISIGTPPQSFRVLPSTAGSETWVPVPDGCTPDDVDDCPSLRGANPFNGNSSPGFRTNRSSTWEQIGLYDLDLENDLGYTAHGLYGHDTVALGNPSGDGALAVNHSVVAGMADKDYFLGVFGLGSRPTSFSTGNANNSESFIQLARDSKQIPSLSYGYTAGAVYQGKRVQGNLVLGGYDQARFEANDLTFPFSSVSERALTVGVQSIIAEDTLLGVVSFTEGSGGFLSVIDSTVPHLWMPNSTCDRFAEALGLFYDDQTDLYTINDTMHSRVTDLNPSFTFRIGNNEYDDGSAINIELPYGAFDLQASWPIYQNPTNYFPIRRSQNENQYTLGRALLQQAYLVVDYERENFSLSQAVFEDPMPASRVVTIEPVGNDTPDGDSSSLSAGVIAGIAIGAFVGVALIGLAIWFLIRRKRRRDAEKARELDDTAVHHMEAKGAEHSDAGLSEMEARAPMPEMESPAGTLLKPPGTPGSPATPSGTHMTPLAEMSGGPREGWHELESPAIRYEMPGDHEYIPKRGA